MTLHPAYDALRKHNIRFFTSGRDWTDDCLECGSKNSLSVHYDDDVAEFRCKACGRSGSEQLRPVPAKPAGNGKPRDDAEYQRALEEAKREFDSEPKQEPEQNLEENLVEEAFAEEFPEDNEPEPQLQPAAEDPTGDAAEGAGDGSYSHVWRSKDHDYPCTPTGEEQRAPDGRIYARVRTPDGDQNFVPKDELAPKDDPDAEPEQPEKPEPKPEPARDEAPQQKAPDDDLTIVLAAKLKRKPDGPFSAEELAQFERLKREQPLPFARLCTRYPALAAAIKLDAATVQAALENTGKKDVVELFIALVLAADLDPLEIDALLWLVVKKAEVGYRPLASTLKKARDEQAAQRDEQAKQHAKQAKAQQHAAQRDEAERLLAELNRDNCVVLDGGKTLVLRFEEMEHVAGGEHYIYRVPTYLSFRAFRDFYLNRHIMAGKEEPKWIDIGSWWLHHPQRRQYSGVIFKPGDKRSEIDGKFNLWTGWGVEPKPGDWSLVDEHIRVVLTAGDKALYDYTINWLAYAVQHPAEQAETAIVFIGDPGTGKGTLGKALCRIFGQHSLHLSSADDLTGKFNAHLRQCSFLFGDECYGPTDKRAEGQLKRMITENTLMIEPKGRDKVRVQNRLHIMMASNHEWVVPASAHERRFAVGRVADTHRQDPAWFGPLYKQMQDGGYAAMLYDLLHRDLGNWHPRQIVRTRALSKQQEESLSALDAWWLELLQTGVLAGTDELAPEKAISNRYEKKITERDGGSYGGFGNYNSRDGGISGGYDRERTRTVWRDGLFDQARRSSPKLKNATDAALGRYLTDRGCKRCWVHGERGWEFPPLAKCRKDWKERFPHTVWDDQKITDWKPADGNDAADDDSNDFE